MWLSDHDLKQIDEDYVGRLEADKLRGLLLKVLADLKETRERLNQNPGNSSRPPSTRAPWERTAQDEEDDGEEEPLAEEEPAEDHEETKHKELNTEEQSQKSEGTEETGKGKPGKPGKRKGAPGYGRRLELEVTEERIHRAGACAACGCALPQDAPFRASTGRYELELKDPSSGAPGIEVTNIKHLYGECLCACGHWTRTEPSRCPAEEGWAVELTEWHLAGPMLVAFIASLGMRQRLSRKRIQEFLHDWLHLSLGTATINQCIHEAARAVEPVVEEEILAAVRQAELLYADETSWKEQRNALWLWVFTCATATLFIVGRRNREMLQRVLSDAFNGSLMSDGYRVYRQYQRRLRCLPHLVRKARGLEQSCEKEAHLFGRRALQELETLMEAVYQAREGPPAVPLSQQHAIRLGKFRAFCQRHWDAEHKKTRELAREFIYDWAAIWAVLDDPSLPLTNNEAERALRHWVISRRISFGTRTPQGTRAFALLASVIETCRKRQVSPWLYIAEVVAKRRKGNPAPPLPQPAV